MKRYDTRNIEPKWQKTWQDSNLYAAQDFSDKPKYVMLTEFPYPSGDGLHLGHVREYTLGDIMARFKRMQGYNVLYPMSYDAFGLPTENFAIKHKIAPQVATDQNVGNFQQQFESLGYSIDWSRSFRTTDPSYYKWTQWLFLQFFKHGLAYQDDISINWCPKCKTGLANEEVVNGRHERCGTVVEKKQLKQWLLKITEYADRLIDGLQTVDFPSRIADQQINWIGRSKGAEVVFALAKMGDGARVMGNGDAEIRVFTTRPDTLFGATFMVLAPEHPLVARITTANQKKAVDDYVKQAQAKSDVDRQDTDREKTGVFTGAYAINPANGKEIPVWIADYVLMGYGTGAIMAVPAHDERDGAFAKKFNLPIEVVVAQDFGDPLPDAKPVEGVVVIGYDPKTKKYLSLNHDGKARLVSGGREPEESFEQSAHRELREEAGYGNVQALIPLGAPVYSYYNNPMKGPRRSLGYNYLAILDSTQGVEQELESHEAFAPQWHLFDELVSAVRGYPGGRDHWIEALNRARSAAIAFDESRNYVPDFYTGEGVLINSGPYDGLASSEAREKIVADLTAKGVAAEKTQYRLRDWIFSRQHYWGEPIPIIHCPEHGAVPVPDDHLPVTLPDVEQYEPTDTGESPLAAIEDWVNTTCPTCDGPAKRETDTMPNWAGSSWYYLRYFDAHNDTAFADRKKLDYWGAVDMYLGGMEHTTLHLLYSRFWHQFFYDIGLVPTPEPYAARRGQGIILAPDGSKMSKSKGNVINPNEIIDAGYGADALRLSIAFLAPYDMTTPWSPEGVAGTHRFLARLWTLVQDYVESDDTASTEVADKLLRSSTHRAIKKVSTDLHTMGFNTAIAALMETLNDFYKIKAAHGFGDKKAWGESLVVFVQLLAPYAPHITEELWQTLGCDGSVHIAAWPVHNEAYLVTDTVTVAVQVNGKLRGEVVVAHDSSQADIEVAARAIENVASYLTGDVRKVVYVPGKILNFVV